MDKQQTIAIFKKLFIDVLNDPSLEFEVKYRDRFSNYETLDFISGVNATAYYSVLGKKLRCSICCCDSVIYTI